MPRCAIYARFSSDRQSATSAEDQVRICRERADREGWEVAQVYADLAISGASNRRPGMTAMLADAGAGSFDIVLSEAIDRIARNQADIATIYQRLDFAQVRIVTLSEGDVNELHIGLKGTMSALFLRDLADKIRRGQRGAVGRGRVSGGLCYGYDAVPELRSDGTVDRGVRRINEEQAEIVRRIYREFITGRSGKAIAHGLNADGISSARGGEWRAAAIVGHGRRKIGVLRNPIYVGKFIYGRVRMLVDPESRNRVSRLNDPSEQLVAELPDLAIVDQATFYAAQEQFQDRAALPLERRPRARRLLSGLVRCGLCGGSFSVVTTNRWGCTRHREAGTCDNARRIGTAELEERVLAGLKRKLLAPEAVALMVREYHQERTRLAQQSARTRSTAERRLGTLEAAIARLVGAFADGGAEFAEVRDAIDERRRERDRLRSDLAELDAMPVIALHPQIAEAYRKRIAGLALTIGASADSEVARQVRALIDRVTVKAAPAGGCDVEVLGSLQAVLELANDRPPPAGRTSRMFQVVAEEGLEPPTRGL